MLLPEVNPQLALEVFEEMKLNQGEQSVLECAAVRCGHVRSCGVFYRTGPDNASLTASKDDAGNLGSERTVAAFSGSLRILCSPLVCAATSLDTRSSGWPSGGALNRPGSGDTERPPDPGTRAYGTGPSRAEPGGIPTGLDTCFGFLLIVSVRVLFKISVRVLLRPTFRVSFRVSTKFV